MSIFRKQFPSKLGVTSKTLIATTGRAGSTFLVAQLTLCGLNTGYSKEHVMNVTAGLEIGSFSCGVDIVKSTVPIRSVISECDQLLMLMRDPVQSCLSRESVGVDGNGGSEGFSINEGITIAVNKVQEFVGWSAMLRKPVRFLEYPTFMTHPSTAWPVIDAMFPITYDQWMKSHELLFKPEMTHSYDEHIM